MTRQTTTRRPGTATGPERFQVSGAPPAARPGAASVGAALLLVTVVVGVPAVLVALGGLPSLLTSWPTREQLTATIGLSQVLAVLLWVVWIAWLQFTVCVAVEVPSALSGVGLPARVPLSGPSQRAARTLVASAVLLVTLAGQASALAPGHAPGSEAATTSTTAGVTSAATAAPDAVLAPTSSTAGSPDAVAGAEQQPSYWLGDIQLEPDEGRALLGRRVYVVQPPEGRYHDNLWDIAERTMQDGRRYREIFELNRERPQPDGGELTLARLIYPNWLLVMPEDATGVGRVTARPAEPTATAATDPATADVHDGATGTVSAARGEGFGLLPAAGDNAVSPSVAETARTPVGDAFPSLVGAGLLAAGLLGAIEAARRRQRTRAAEGEAIELEVALRIGAEPRRAARLHAALRSVGASHHAARRALPAVYAVTVDDLQVALLCSPPALDPPAPWEAEDGGRRWVLRSSADRLVAGARAAVPFPGLVSLGRDQDGADVLVDLEAAQGPIAVTGDLEAAGEVVAALAAELATNPWSAELEVHGWGLPPAMTALGQRYRESDPADVLESWSAGGHHGNVLTGRTTDGSGAWAGRYLLLGAAPAADVAERIQQVTSGRVRRPWGVVCAGAVPGARWTWEVAAGELRAPSLGLVVRPNRLRATDVELVAGLLAPAADAPDRTPSAARSGAPAERPEVPEPSRAAPLRTLFSAPVTVRVLGAPAVTAPGPVDADRVALLTEVVVNLALHPGGVHPAVLAGDVWPLGVSAEVRDATLARAARWLGNGEAGPHLLRRDGGRWQLGAEVVLDWDVVLTLLRRSRATPDPRQEREDLADALDVGRAAALSDRPVGRYSWLARARLERVSLELLVDAAHRLSRICRDDGDPVGATRAARDGLRVAPAADVLWEDLLLAAADLGGPDAVRGVAAELEQAVRRAQVPHLPAPVVALLEDLLPGGARGASGA